MFSLYFFGGIVVRVSIVSEVEYFVWLGICLEGFGFGLVFRGSLGYF